MGCIKNSDPKADECELVSFHLHNVFCTNKNYKFIATVIVGMVEWWAVNGKYAYA